MLFRLQPIIYSLIFALALETVVFKEVYFFKVAVFLIVFSVFVVWPLARKLRFLAIPFFLSLGSLNLLYLIDNDQEKHAFIALSFIVYYLALMGAYRLKIYDCDQTAQGMVNLATIATIFFWFSANYGWFLNFDISPWVLVVTFIGSTFLISLPSLRISASMQMKKKQEAQSLMEQEVENLEHKKGRKKTPSEPVPTYMLINNWVILFLNFILSLVVAQVIWGLSLWPFGYLTTGVVALIIYFVFWDVIRNFVQGSLTKNLILTKIFLAGMSILGVLVTARWEMVK